MKLWQKILLTILAAVVFWAVFGCSKPVWSSNDLGDESVPTVGHLTDAARVFNEKYFYGGLPLKDTKIELTNSIEKDAMAHIDQMSDGTWRIQISKKYNPVEKQAEMSEAHELCHLEDRMLSRDEGVTGHDNAFQACMQRLAHDGAFKELW